MADPKLVPLDFDPFATKLPKLVPLDNDPFEKAAPPVAAEGPRKYDLAEVPQHAASNFVRDLGSELGKMWDGVKNAVAHPIDTADVLSRSAVTNVFPRRGAEQIGWAAKQLGAEPEAVDAAIKHLYEPRDTLVADLEKHYGGAEEIKRTIAENPARFLMDVSMLASPAAAAKNAPGAVGKVGKAADVVATATDPIALGGKVLQKGVEPLITGQIGVASGVGSAPLKEAARTGFEGGEQAANFWRAYKNGVPAEEIIGAAEQGVQHMKQKMQMIFDVRKNDPQFGWANDPSALNFDPVTKAWKQTVDSLTTKSGKRTIGDDEWNQIQKVGAVVAEWERDIKAGAMKGTPDDFDGLKRRIASIYPDGEARQLRRVVTKMKNAVGNEIKNQAPGYARAMKDYSQAMDSLDELKAAFSLNDKASMQTQMSKLQSVMRNNAASQYGLREKKLTQLEDEGLASVRPFLAGSSLGSWEPRGFGRIGTSGILPTALGATIAGPLGAGLMAGANTAASIPKISGGAYHGLGRLAGAPDRLAERISSRLGKNAPRRGFFYEGLGRTPRAAARQVGNLEQEMEPQGYFGGP
jgi:hypothetical protein